VFLISISGFTALHFACQNGDSEMVKLLIKNLARTNVEDIID